MKLGYARCSTLDQNLDWQIDALTNNDSKAYPFDEISKTTGISRAILYKYVKLRKEKNQ